MAKRHLKVLSDSLAKMYVKASEMYAEIAEIFQGEMIDSETLEEFHSIKRPLDFELTNLSSMLSTAISSRGEFLKLLNKQVTMRYFWQKTISDFISEKGEEEYSKLPVAADYAKLLIKSEEACDFLREIDRIASIPNRKKKRHTFGSSETWLLDAVRNYLRGLEGFIEEL